MSRQCTAQFLLSCVFPWFEVSPLSVAQTWHWFTSVSTVLPKIKEDAPKSLGLGWEGLWQAPTDPAPPHHYRRWVPVSCWGLWGKGRCAVVFAAWVCRSSRRREHKKWRSYSRNDAGALMSSGPRLRFRVSGFKVSGFSALHFKTFRERAKGNISKNRMFDNPKAQGKIDDAGLNGKFCHQKGILVIFSFSDVSDAFWQCGSS